MPTRQEREEQKTREIERITSRVRDTADRLFDGKLPQGFLYWAADLHLDQTANTPTEDDLLGSITDGKDDLELDAYYVDDDARIVYLFQSKYRAKPGNLPMSDLANFLDVPNKLASPHILASLTNQKIAQFAPTFRRCVLDRYELQLVYLTTARATKRLQVRASDWADSAFSLEIGGEEVSVPHSVVIRDIQDLISVVDSLNEIKEIELTLEIDPSAYHESKLGEFGCLIATLDLIKLAETFDEHRYAIFRHNPRGPLGSASIVNRYIRETLADPTRRRLFQLMNNGLSAVCASFKVLHDGDEAVRVSVRDFQIVNGCQTTFTVYDHWRRGGKLDGATVTLKLAEVPSSSSIVRHEISSASNKQSQMKDWDFLFDEPEQTRLQREFSELTPPVFYELRRGEYKYIADIKGSEKATIKDIAQAMWAFIGSPGEAKDRLREIPRSLSVQGAYREVFFPGVEAERLRLPWIVYRRIQDEWLKYNIATGKGGDEREHGRLHILWLVGRSVVGTHNVKRYHDLPIGKVRRLTDTLDEWFPAHHKIAIDTIRYVVEVKDEAARDVGRTLSLRQLFRSGEHYETFIRRHNREIDDNLPALGGALAVA